MPPAGLAAWLSCPREPPGFARDSGANGATCVRGARVQTTAAQPQGVTTRSESKQVKAPHGSLAALGHRLARPIVLDELGAVVDCDAIAGVSAHEAAAFTRVFAVREPIDVYIVARLPTQPGNEGLLG